MILRITALIWLGVVLGILASSASAQSIQTVDMAFTGSSLDLSPVLTVVETENPAQAIELPSPTGGTAAALQLEATGPGPRHRWQIVGLTNSSDTGRSIVLEVPHQGFVGSGVLWPELPGRRFIAIAAGGPLALQPVAATGSDAFALTLPAGATAAIAFELDQGIALPATLWQRDAFELHKGNLAFFRGILLGVMVLITIGMMALYAMRSRALFLAAAGFAACCTGFITLETGILAGYLAGIGVSGFGLAEARALVEGLMASLLIVNFVTLTDLRRVSPAAGNAVLLLAGLAVALPVYGMAEPQIASGLARVVFGLAVAAGLAATFELWRRGEPQAETALVSWSAIALWTFIAAVSAVAGGDPALIGPFLSAALGTVQVALAFTLAHFAFSQGFLARPFYQEAGRRAMALAGAEAHVWDWQPVTGDLHIGEDLERALGQPPGLLAQGGVEALLELMHPADRSQYLSGIAAYDIHGRSAIERDFRLRRGDGDYRWFQLRARAMAGSGRQPIRCIGTLSDITGSKLTEERLLSDAVYDRVTGLPNRALFLDRLSRAAAQADAAGHAGLHVLLVDIDRFKIANDGLGHEAGDRLLNVIGRRLGALMDGASSLARFPGDQFAVLFAPVDADRDIIAFAEQLRKAVARPIDLEMQEIFLTASVGVVTYRGPGHSAEQMVKDAAIALYEAKRRALDSAEFFSPAMRDDRAELVVRENELRRAIEREEIEVHYQPIARLADMNLAGFEALVRWRHPTLGLLLPESFLGLAEETGMIRNIGRAVLNEAARQLGIWQRGFRPAEPIFVAVNISSAQLIETDLIEDIKLVLHREGVRRETLKIEVTESIIMQYPERAEQILERLRELGVGLACDDFGTGYSSLASLRRLPFDTLKVDKSFVNLEGQNERAEIILDAIVGMAHAMGLTIVAEGIESQEQVDRLGAIDCDYGQGYFIGRPMTAKQVSEALAGLPYASASGRTAITWLWERAAKDPLPEAVAEEVTAENIQKAAGRSPPPLGSSPMAPRPKPVEEPPAAQTTRRRRRRKTKPSSDAKSS